MGNSVVDYFIVSESVFNYMHRLCVLDSIISWHLPIALTVTYQDSSDVDKNTQDDDSIDSFSYIKWDESRSGDFFTLFKIRKLYTENTTSNSRNKQKSVWGIRDIHRHVT